MKPALFGLRVQGFWILSLGVGDEGCGGFSVELRDVGLRLIPKSLNFVCNLPRCTAGPAAFGRHGCLYDWYSFVFVSAGAKPLS